MPDAISDRGATLEASMIDHAVADRWASTPGFPECARRWNWSRAEWPAVLAPGTEPGSAAERESVVGTQALADAFWQWIDGIERERHFEPLDPLDFARFAAGSLLTHLLQTHPGPLPGTDRAGEVEALTRLAMTLLAASVAALDAAPVQVRMGENALATWASFVENVREDPSLAVPFLDSFTGAEPVWHFPLTLGERPALQRAMRRARTSPSVA